jgi:hypothetical protein
MTSPETKILSTCFITLEQERRNKKIKRKKNKHRVRLFDKVVYELQTYFWTFG